MGTVAENVLDAVEILVDNKVADLQFNKTIRGKIAEVIDASIGQYKIQYQNSYFTAYSADVSATYTKGTDVYVEILSSDFEKNAVILGTVRRLGSNYLTIVEKLDRYYEIGPKQGNQEDEVGLCSFGGSQTIPININLDALSMREAAAAADSLQVAMKVKTVLEAKQRAGGGNYGLRIKAKYYNAKYVDHEVAAAADDNIVEREYIFDINDMLGQPYKYTTPSNQYTIFPIDADNFIEITFIEAFCKDFPNTEAGKPNDIFLSDIHFQFLHTLTDEELANTSLKITTPLGGYFSGNNTGDKILHADLRVRGKKVNYSVQQVDFYWFKRNLEVDANDPRFSSYGGNGWECLNKMGGGSFLPASYEYNIKYISYDSEGHAIENYPSQETPFKCVAVFTESGQSVALSSTIIFKNLTKDVKFKITSTSGTTFSFNVGATTLELVSDNFTPDTNTKYCWTESIDGGAAVYFQGNKFISNNTIDVTISTPAARLLTYECSVYQNDVLQGTASITLVNNYESLNYTLVIKDSQQIFKYDTYGVSPASQATAAADRMTIPILSFDIYDKQGNVINIADADKNKYMTIRWIWPTPVGDLINTEMVASWDNCRSRNATMLTTTEQNMQVMSLRDIANNSSIERFVLLNKPTFTYGILDRYNATYANTDSSRNNIRLEVDYQGEFLSATTNFTFTKEGELGTNGTKYVARIVPVEGYEDIFLRYGNNRENIYTIAPSGQGYVISNVGTKVAINTLFKAELWDGSSDVASSAKVTWSLAQSTNRNTAKPRLTIINDNGIIYLQTVTRESGKVYSNSNIIQATFELEAVAGKKMKYYATYPIIYTTGAENNKYLWIIDGYREVMYDSDGTRGRFNQLPFRPRWLNASGLSNIPNSLSIDAWSSSWGTAAEKVEQTEDQFTIEPPTYFINDTVGHYIHLTYNNIHTYLPIELYLNRYGMSAMNDWDGNSIQINNDGGYILSPQVGAGQKENDNSFTGITIGTTFQDTRNSTKDRQIGMFGYYHGQRSLFLDAETGDAEFGVASEGQIKIRASDGQGTISDGHYHYNHEVQYDPTNPQEGAGRGLKIKFTSTPKDPADADDELGPYIKYGSGNFMVDAQGHITARGGGTIAGWKITDDYLRSPDDYSTLYAQNGPGMTLITGDSGVAYTGRNWNTTRPTRFNIHDRFKVDADGAIISTAGVIGSWKIGEQSLQSKDNNTFLYSNSTDNSGLYSINPNDSTHKQVMRIGVVGSKTNADNIKFGVGSDGRLVGASADYNFTPNKRIWEITPNGVAYFTDIKIRNQNAVYHGKNEQYNTNNFLWYGNDGNGNYPKIFELNDTSCNVGGWTITGDTLQAGKTYITSSHSNAANKTVISVNDALKIYGTGDLATQGSLNASGGGTIGGASFGRGTNGSVNFPAGVMQFGGKTVTLGTVAAVTGFTNAKVTVDKDVITYVTSVSGGGESEVSASTSSSTIVTGVEITLSWQGKEYKAMTNVDYNQAPLLGPYKIF